jgi:hypothetical protein
MKESFRFGKRRIVKYPTAFIKIFDGARKSRRLARFRPNPMRHEKQKKRAPCEGERYPLSRQSYRRETP